MPLTDYTNYSYFNTCKSLQFVQMLIRFLQTVMFITFTVSANRRTFFFLLFIEAVSSKKFASVLRFVQTVEQWQIFFLQRFV